MVVLSMTGLMILVIEMMMCSYMEVIEDWVYLDDLSLLMIWSMMWVMILIVCLHSKLFAYIFISGLFVILFYSTSSWLLFYSSFELSMIPLFVMILSYSYKPERIMASQLLFFYTVLCSFPLLGALLFISMKNGSMNMTCSNLVYCPMFIELCLMAFLVKFPMFFIHSWLLSAHVEAPVEGSMYLAGILLKLGPYGLMRMLFYFNFNVEFIMFLISIALLGAVVSSLMSISCMDMKMSVAYSSVSHMNLALAANLGYSSYSSWGVIGLILAHSFSSCILFYSVTHSYTESGSRSPILIKGSISWSMVLSMLGSCSWLISINIPPFLGAMGELTIVFYLISLSMLCLVFVSLYSVLSCLYSTFLLAIQFNTITQFPAKMGSKVDTFMISMYFISLFPQFVLYFISDLIMLG